MRIGVIIGRIGDVDGVALETEKWIEVLERQGHELYILSGLFQEHVVPPERETRYRPLSFFSPECEWEQNRAFFYPPDDPDELLEVVHENARHVAERIFAWVLENRIEALVSQNASALPCHLSMGLGIKLAVERMAIPTVAHDHDFAWERGHRYDSKFREIDELVDQAFPLCLPHVHHAVINSNAREQLRERHGIEAVLVPNVMDFEKPFGERDEYNSDLLHHLGLEADDKPLFQVTRIVKRKRIEVAIELVSRLDDPRIKLVVTGSAADDERKGYFKTLVDRIRDERLEERVHFAYRSIMSQRGTALDGRKIYSLSDAYSHAMGCTYFSEYEGFGNAFVEAVLAKRPIFVNSYEPVYRADIGSKGFHCVTLEDNVLTDEAVAEVDEILHNDALRKEIVEHNFQLGRTHFSFEVLEEKLDTLFSF